MVRSTGNLSSMYKYLSTGLCPMKKDMYIIMYNKIMYCRGPISHNGGSG